MNMKKILGVLGVIGGVAGLIVSGREVADGIKAVREPEPEKDFDGTPCDSVEGCSYVEFKEKEAEEFDEIYFVEE